MKYIIMCGGNYDNLNTPKQLLKVNGEVLVERTIRLLKENGIKDIAISTNNPAFDYLDIEILKHKNKYVYSEKTKTSEASWLNAYYPTEETACYLHGDVYFSENAIKTIVETPVKNTMFFCIRDLQDGRPVGVNPKGREPLAYKVQNQKVFRKAINDLLQMIDEGKFTGKIEPISWHLYRQLNGLDLMFNAQGFDANNIFKIKGDYVVIDDYTTDVDFLKDIPLIEKYIRIAKGVENMVQVEVIKDFHLGAFNEIKNIVRAKKSKNSYGFLYIGDTFECTSEMALYLSNDPKSTKKNPENKPFVKTIHKPKEEAMVKKEELKEEPKVEAEEVKFKRTTRRRKSVAKK